MSVTQNNSTVLFDDDTTVNDTIGASILEDLFEGEEIETLQMSDNPDDTLSQSLGNSQVSHASERFRYQSDLGEGAYGYGLSLSALGELELCCSWNSRRHAGRRRGQLHTRTERASIITLFINAIACPGNTLILYL